ncbi:DNA replication and repair protein RecF [Patescibacteria group bacterium]|nr:DNA replication and repair protein RecF [Patescibacteria group bacterium]
MPIKEIRVRGMRPYDLFSVVLDEHITLVLGNNGTGKTTLLEALFYMAQGTSFRGRDRDMIAHDSTRTDLLQIDDDGSERRASLQQSADDKVKKSFIIDGKTTMRMLSKHRQPVVLFEPDELRLLSSSPERRRKFFDGILTRLYPQYATVLARYQRVLMQRNELLKQREMLDSETWESQLFVWDIKLAELATTITTMRREFIVTSNTHIGRLYSVLADAEHHVTISYVSSIGADNYRQSLINHLTAQRITDSYRGYTSSGPHRDDFSVQLDGHAAGETASRGEMRSIMLAYKLLEIELQQEAYGSTPLILMDDVFSELDVTREQQLMAALAGYQTVITATDLRDELKIHAKIVTLHQS